MYKGFATKDWSTGGAYPHDGTWRRLCIPALEKSVCSNRWIEALKTDELRLVRETSSVRCCWNKNFKLIIRDQ
ncbi:hypothetical protein Bca4012_062603 [Brassica carinata]